MLKLLPRFLSPKTIFPALFLGLFLNLSAEAAPTFDASQMGDIALVVASEQGFGASSFGHAFLRLQRKSGFWAPNDYVIEIAADNNGHDFSLFRGLGWIAPYPAKMSVLSYGQMLDLKTREELRDLDNYVLDLTPEQKARTLSIIQRMAEKGEVGAYRFITDNCASYVSEVLNEGIADSLKDVSSNIPARLPKKLKDLGLIKSSFTDKSATTIRDLLLQKFPQPALEGNLALLWGSLKNQLGSLELGQRVFAYTKLFYLMQSDLASAELRSLSHSLLRQFIMQESMDLRTDLRKTFLEEAGSSKMHVFPMFGELPDLHELRSVRGLHLEADKAGVLVRIDNNAPSSVDDGYEYPLPHDFVRLNQLRFDQSQELIYFGDKAIGAQFLDDDVYEDGIFAPGISLFHEIVKPPNSREKVLVYVVLDETRELKPVHWQSQDLIDITNLETANITPGGACYGVATLQEDFYLRAVFAPELPRLADPGAYLDLILKMTQGDYVIIPGFSSIRELTKSVDRKALLELVVRMNEELNQFGKRLKNYWDSEGFDDDSVKDLQTLTRIGIPAPLVFRKKATALAHIMLVQDAQDAGDHYQLMVYDPNIGISDNILTKKGFDLRGKFYPDTEGARLYPVHLMETYLSLERKKKLLSPEFFRYVGLTGHYNFSAREIGVF